ncbi:hypothetical protein ACH5RR_018358 [Cinchona calisaya]|uniref:Lipocalin n=1 Tax=Cinchona calisaya TaxID=153742 RepID=A0ABD2ZLR9_9GENT
MLLLWNRDEDEVVKADTKPFMAGFNATEVVYYHSNIDPHRIIKNKVNGKLEVAKMTLLIVEKGWKAESKVDMPKRCLYQFLHRNSKEVRECKSVVHYADTICGQKMN